MGNKIKLKKDLAYNINGVECKITNVPFEKIDADGEEFINISDAIKIEIIVDLMLSNKIPNEVDFDKA